jgi:hypothetical protein
VILGELGNIPLWEFDLGPCVGGLGLVRQFSFMGSLFGELCRWFWVVLGELGNFPTWRVD